MGIFVRNESKTNKANITIFETIQTTITLDEYECEKNEKLVKVSKMFKPNNTQYTDIELYLIFLWISRNFDFIREISRIK